MKHSHFIILIGAIALLIFAFISLSPRMAGKNSSMQHTGKAQSDQQKVAANPPSAKALVIDGRGISPLCFINMDGENDKPAYTTENCGAGHYVVDKEAEMNPMGKRFISTAYKSQFDDTLRGQVGYTYLGDVDGHKALWIVQNGGGSGVFISLVLADYNSDKKQLETVKTIASGDRCNGSVSTAHIADGTLSYERDLTPYDMLGLTGDDDTLKSPAAEQIPSCASCCYGWAIYRDNEFIGLQFDPRLPQGLAGKDYAKAPAAEKCFDDLAGHSFEEHKGYFNADAFKDFIGEVKGSCLKPAESK